MKRSLGIALVLAVVTAVGIASPLVAASVACAEDGCTDCCDLDCSLCPCCVHGPQIAADEPDRRSAGGPAGGLRPDECVAPPEPLPRDVLHVPRLVPPVS